MPKKKFAVDEGLAPQRAAKIPVTIRREMVEGDDGSTISVELAIQIAMLAERAYRRGVQQALAEAERRNLPSQTNVYNWRYDPKEDISPRVAEAWDLGNTVMADHVLPRAAMECSPLPELQRLLTTAIGKIKAKSLILSDGGHVGGSERPAGLNEACAALYSVGAVITAMTPLLTRLLVGLESFLRG